LETAVSRLDKAKTIPEFHALAIDFSKLAADEKNNWLSWYYAAYCNVVTAFLNKDDPGAIRAFADLARTEIDQSLKAGGNRLTKKDSSEIFCIYSMVYSSMIMINRTLNGIKFGPVSGKYLNSARALDPANPRAVYLAGKAKYETPAFWGGSKSRAKELFREALRLLNGSGAAGVYPHWGRKETEEMLARYQQ
jgi:hypothetical protein